MTAEEHRQPEERTDRAREGLQPQASGSGPLLERDYWAVIEDARLGPQEVAELVAQRFEEFAPPSLVRFQRRCEPGPLQPGDELDVRIAVAGTFAVRVIHRSANSLTVATLHRHPEAGRITFGAYRNRQGDVVFQIRSRARSRSADRYLGFLIAGDPMQTNTWGDFVNRVAATVGSGVRGYVHAEKRVVDVEPGDRGMDAPTFIAEGA